MDKLDFENLKLLVVSTLAPLISYLYPTAHILLALALAFGFNIYCGMRCDGVTVSRCHNFSMKKLWHAMAELLMYIVIILLVYLICKLQGSEKTALLITHTLTWIMIYIYITSSFKNLIRYNPTNKVYRIVYHFLRFEFKRMLPSYLTPIIERINKEEDRKKEKKEEG